MTTTLGDHLVRQRQQRAGGERQPDVSASTAPTGPIGYAAENNAAGPLIVLGRVGSRCGSLRYCDSDVWVTENALVCRAKDPRETRYWYYALQTCRLGDHRSGIGTAAAQSEDPA